MTSFLTQHGVLVALVCAGAALVYGAVTSRSLLALSPGNERMRCDLRRRAGGRPRLPEPPVHDHRRRRRDPVHRADPDPEHPGRDRVRDRRPAVGLGRLHRDERVGARQRARRRVRARRRLAGAGRRVPRRRRHRPARRRPRADRRRRLLRHPHLDRRREPGERRQRADRPRLRRLADLGVRPPRRRHLHEGGRRRRRPGRQDRGRHPRGRPPQPGGDRRQRRRQRRRLRRHGGRPVRDLRGHRGRGDAARRAAVRPAVRRRAVPAGARRRLDHRLDHRHVRGPLARRKRRAGAVPGADHLRRAGRARVPPDHLLDDERRHLQGERPDPRLDAALVEVLPLRADRDRRHRVPVRDHRLLHLDAVRAGEEHRAGVADRPRDEHHPGPRPGLPVDRAAGDRDRARDPRRLEARGRRQRAGSTGSAWR